jgi:hypothetical protein
MKGRSETHLCLYGFFPVVLRRFASPMKMEEMEGRVRVRSKWGEGQ